MVDGVPTIQWLILGSSSKCFGQKQRLPEYIHTPVVYNSVPKYTCTFNINTYQVIQTVLINQDRVVWHGRVRGRAYSLRRGSSQNIQQVPPLPTLARPKTMEAVSYTHLTLPTTPYV